MTKPDPATQDTYGASLIGAERRRQIDVEGYTAEYDGNQPTQDLIDAAVGYAELVSDLLSLSDRDPKETPAFWPWDDKYWKPVLTGSAVTTSDLIRNLVKAGALIAAAIDAISESGQSVADIGRSVDA